MMIGVRAGLAVAEDADRVAGQDGGAERLLMRAVVAALARAAALPVGTAAAVLAPATVGVLGTPWTGADGEGPTLGHDHLPDHD
ncbi:hypothetical protein AB0O91_21090 [Kitasatospora sp. NPDC089797]|uniref:hypothetical protein n=1 Tax=Kitasatospora sp. NPDC089797 TaxID=3155298 RepID=UPI00342672BE